MFDERVLEMRHLVRWVFFNLFTGNNDSHAKNLSIYSVPSQGVTLTPFYDLMCTRIYPGLSKEFAFNVGGEVLPGQMGHAQLQGMAQQLGMKPLYLQTVADDVAVKVLVAIDQVVNVLSPRLAHSSQTFAEHLTHEVKSITKKAQARFQRTP
mgnify:CR=1 FL=1